MFTPDSRAIRHRLFGCAVGLLLASASFAGSACESLSPCLCVKRVGNSFVGRSLELYAQTPGKDPQMIAPMRDLGFDLAALGFAHGPGALDRRLTQTQFALSSDGKAVVYYSIARPGAGLYRHVCGGGSKLLRSERQCRVSRTMQGLTGLPPDVMVFELVDSLLNPHQATYALRADGYETPLVLLDAPPLHAPAYEGRIAAVDSLLRGGADPLAQDLLGLTAVDVALWAGREDAAIRLIGGAPRDTAILQEFLSVAIQYGRWKAAEVVLERGVDPNRPIVRRTGPFAPITPLMIALENPHTPQLQRFMFATGSLEPVRPATDVAAGVRFLLDHGADPDAQDAKGRTALHAIASVADPVASTAVGMVVEAARVLIDGGADATATTARGNTPLHTLVGAHSDISYTSPGFEKKWGHDPYSELLALYVARTKNLEVRNADGLNPLQRAIGSMNFLAARYLVAHGASDEVEFNGHPVREILAAELKSHKSSFLDKVEAASSNPGRSRHQKFRDEFARRYGGNPKVQSPFFRSDE